MFTIFKKLFRASTDGGVVGRGGVEMGEARAREIVGGGVAVAVTTVATSRSEVGASGLSADVVHLSLGAIVGRFSEDLTSLVLREPDATMTIALPLFLVAKQLSTGAVKISLASLHRLAPRGIFGPLPVGEKRQVEIPLKEVFKHLRPADLARRKDQRAFEVPDGEFTVFGNAKNPREIASASAGRLSRSEAGVLRMPSPVREEESPVTTLDVGDSPDRTDFSLSGLRLVEPSVEDELISPAGDLARVVEMDAEIPDLVGASSVCEVVEAGPFRLLVEAKVEVEVEAKVEGEVEAKVEGEAEVEVSPSAEDALGITPDELVRKIGELSGVRGAMISLREGLAVSSMLSTGMRAEVLAAFIPQIFVRVEQYTGEMDLGAIDQLVLSTESGRCQLNRRGEIFLSVFGEKGDGVPVEELEKYVGIFREGNLGIGI
jgi:predicted regulator of Ras-like GTPase activity (Roadblock/LC7/MglB family)